MRPPLERGLHQWVDADVIDLQTADRIRTFESSPQSPGLRWPIVLAVAFGAAMVVGGLLLFVDGHWEDLPPTQQFLLVVAMVTGFHFAGGALMPRVRALGLALHAAGTVALGSGIFLAGQIFNLQERWWGGGTDIAEQIFILLGHWPSGVLLWAIGATLTWWVLRDWLQAALVALLIPAWIASEWSARAQHVSDGDKVLFQFLTLLAITYLSAPHGEDKSDFRRALSWIGGLALLPLAAMLSTGEFWARYFWLATLIPLRWFGMHIFLRPARMSISLIWTGMPIPLRVGGYVMAFGLPLFAAWLLRRRGAIWNIPFALWVFVLGLVNVQDIYGTWSILNEVAAFVLCGFGAIGLMYWGFKERRRERINLGVAGLAMTVVVFYFSSVMNPWGLSASMVGLGLLFLLGGWKLEQFRRKPLAGTSGDKP